MYRNLRDELNILLNTSSHRYSYKHIFWYRPRCKCASPHDSGLILSSLEFYCITQPCCAWYRVRFWSDQETIGCKGWKDKREGAMQNGRPIINDMMSQHSIQKITSFIQWWTIRPRLSMGTMENSLGYCLPVHVKRCNILSSRSHTKDYHHAPTPLT